MSRLKDFAPALKHIADIIERGIREHPELSVGMQTEGIEVIKNLWNKTIKFKIYAVAILRARFVTFEFRSEVSAIH